MTRQSEQKQEFTKASTSLVARLVIAVVIAIAVMLVWINTAVFFNTPLNKKTIQVGLGPVLGRSWPLLRVNVLIKNCWKT